MWKAVVHCSMNNELVDFDVGVGKTQRALFDLYGDRTFLVIREKGPQIKKKLIRPNFFA